MTLHVERFGQGPPLVFLHGFGFHSGVWQSFALRLSEYFHVHLIDVPGFGRSSLTDYQPDNLSAHLMQAIPKQSVVIGWSMGGMIASALALRYPESIRAVIHLSSSPCFLADNHWPGMSKKVLDQFTKRLIDDYERTIREFLLLQFDSCRSDKPLLRQLQGVMAEFVPTTQALRCGLALLSTWDLREALRLNPVKTLYVFGRRDALVPVAVAKALQHWQPAAKIFCIDGAAHLPFLSHQALVIETIKDFL